MKGTQRRALPTGNPRSRRRVLKLRGLVVWTLAACTMAVFGSSSGCRPAAAPGTVSLILGAYTTPREAYDKEIIPAFQRFWKEKTGETIQFQQSYQGSGAQRVRGRFQGRPGGVGRTIEGHL